MMKKVLAMGGSNSKNSINRALAVYTANQLANVDLTVIDLNDYDLPLYSIDFENDQGIPENAKKLNNHLTATDGIVISLAEHNGSYAAAFKSVYDWLSRIDKKVWKSKPMLLMATSPGGRGGATVLQTAIATFPRMGAEVVATFTLPSFDTNFSEDGILDESLKADLEEKIGLFQNAI